MLSLLNEQTEWMQAAIIYSHVDVACCILADVKRRHKRILRHRQTMLDLIQYVHELATVADKTGCMIANSCVACACIRSCLALGGQTTMKHWRRPCAILAGQHVCGSYK